MRWAFLLFAVLAVAGCNEGQDSQNRFDTFAAAPAGWPSSGAALPPPDGTIAQGYAQSETAARQPAEASLEMLMRGQEQFGIFCSPCHGLDGTGEAIVVARGFPHPPSFHDKALRAAPAQLFFDTIAHGYGAMYSYGDRVAPQDRWAIAAYIRALQLSMLHARADAP